MPQITIGTATYSSYASVADADNYLGADIGRATAWALRNDDAKGRALVSASRALNRLGWCDPAPTYDAPPEPLVEAVSMFAADLASNPKLLQAAITAANVKVAKAGSAQVEFFSATTKTATPLPKEIWDTLTGAGLMGCAEAVSTSVDMPYVSGIQGDCDRWPYGGVFWDDDCRSGGC